MRGSRKERRGTAKARNLRNSKQITGGTTSEARKFLKPKAREPHQTSTEITLSYCNKIATK